jgi:4-amino-4-deoxy-L-arabinose transferase-like glycosyltransferase
LDAKAYHTYAVDFLAGTWPGDLPFFHLVLYPFYLGLVYHLGVNLTLAVYGHILLEVLACATLYGLGRLLFNRQTGLLASFIMALYSPLIFYNPCFAQVVLTLPLYLLTLFFLLKAKQTPRPLYLALAGLLTGLTALSRPTFLLILPLAWVWLFLPRKPFQPRAWFPFLRLALLYLGLIFLVTLPVAWHNQRTGGRFAPTTVTGWENIFLGNNPVAEGMGTLDFALYLHLELPGEKYINEVITTDVATGTGYRDATLKFISEQPLAWLNLLGRKINLLLFISDNHLISPYFVHNLQTVPLLTYLPFTWRAIFLAAGLGLLLVKPRQRGWLALLWGSMTLLILIFHIQERFRLLLVPLVILYAAALILAAPRLSVKAYGFALVILALACPFLPQVGWLLALFVLSRLWPLLRQRDWRRLRWPLLAAWSYVVVAGLLGQVLAFVYQAHQPQAIFLGPQVAGPIAVGQSFTVPCKGFNRLDIVIGTYHNPHPHPVTFHLRSTPLSPSDIYSDTFAANELVDRTTHTFTFPTQADSAGQPYFFFLTAPDTVPAEAITLRGAFAQPYNRYAPGQAYIGPVGAWQEFPADFAFTALCQAGLLNLVSQAFQHLAAAQGGSVGLYWGLFIGHGVLWGGALFLLLRPPD